MRYYEHLERDPVMKKIIRRTGKLSLKTSDNSCLFLCRSIISQQLSNKVAAVIEQRFISLLPAEKFSPQAILNITIQQLRAAGLSQQKATYIHHVASFYHDLQLQDADLKKLDDEALIHLLTQIKGVGRWTVAMLLMFGYGRKDVFPIDDYGIRQSMLGHYKIKEGNKRSTDEQLFMIAEKWSPYRTYACLHLWKDRDANK